MRHGRLIITPDGTVKEEVQENRMDDIGNILYLHNVNQSVLTDLV